MATAKTSIRDRQRRVYAESRKSEPTNGHDPSPRISPGRKDGPPADPGLEAARRRAEATFAAVARSGYVAPDEPFDSGSHPSSTEAVIPVALPSAGVTG
jgi:hypothetical protein